MPNAILLVLLEFLQDISGLSASEVALSEVPLHDRCKFDSRHLAGPERLSAVRRLADAIGTRLVQITLCDVGGVEVDHRPSRSSDTYTAESTGILERFPIAASRFGSGRRLSNASNGRTAAARRPRSVTRIGPRLAAWRTHLPVFRCSSRMEIVFMCTL